MKKRSGLVLIVAASACGNPLDGVRKLGDTLPSAEDYQRLGHAFQPPADRSSTDGAAPSADATARPAQPQRPYPDTGGVVSRPFVSPGTTAHTVTAETSCDWVKLDAAERWQGRCTRNAGEVGAHLMLPAVADLNFITFSYQQQAIVEGFGAPVFSPVDNSLTLPQSLAVFSLVLNDAAGLMAVWSPMTSSYHPDQGNCGDTTFYHRNATESMAIWIDQRELAAALPGRVVGRDSFEYQFDLHDEVAVRFAKLTYALRTTSAAAPAFDECNYLSGPHARVVWDGVDGPVTVLIADGGVASVEFGAVTFKSENGFPDFARQAMPIFSSEDDGLSEATKVVTER